MKQIIKKLVAGENLTREESSKAMDMVLDNGATPAQISAFLTLLRTKGETVDEIIGCADMLKKKACHIHPSKNNYVDLVGTGGDGANTFNISTTAAFVVAAAGIPVAKHGNRAISSRSGSIDLLEALNINVDLTPEQVQECVDNVGIGFMYAKSFHKSMKTVAQVRAELGIRTIFNILGPISNPSNARCQMIGVFSKDLTNPLAQSMKDMGVNRGFVMCCDGIDEFTTAKPTNVSEITSNGVIDYIIDKKQHGFEECNLSELVGGTAKENAEITLDILKGASGPKTDTVILNAGACIYIQGSANSLKSGIEIAKETVYSRKSYKKLLEVIEYTNKF